MLTQTSVKPVLFGRTLRKICLGVFAVLVLAASFTTLVPQKTLAATNGQLNFQARLQSAAGGIVADGNYNVEFKLYSASAGGTAEWTEDYTYNSGAGSSDARIRVYNGYLTVNLGSLCAFTAGTCQGYTETAINWNQQQWLTMNIGGTGTTGSFPSMGDGEMSPRLQLTAVPYAFQAGTLSQTDGSGNVGKLSFNTTASNPSITLPDASGTVCLQGTAACGFATGSGTAFLQGGNSFGAQAVFGTNDGNSLVLRTNGSNRLVLDTSGNLQLQQASTFNVASAAAGLSLTIQGGAATSGTNVGGNLILQGGAGASTGASGSVIVKSNTNNSTTAFQVQNASGVALLTADTTNQTVIIRPANDHKTIGSESYAGDFSSGWTTTGWNVSGTTTAVHNTGNTTALVNTNVAVTSGTTYQVGFVLGGICSTTSDTVAVAIGGTTLATINGANCHGDTYTYVGTTSGTAGLTFTPTSSWSGTISGISIKALSGSINPALAVQNAGGGTYLEVRASNNISNLFIGASSGSNVTTACNSTAVGSFALQSLTSACSNSAFGVQALQNTTTGANNAAFGTVALQANTTGGGNTALGSGALQANTTGSSNTAVGSNTLPGNTTGFGNSAVGASALQANTTGGGNTALGHASLHANSTGSDNVAVGYSTLLSSVGGGRNTAVGNYALQNTNGGGNNAAVGYAALQSNVTGSSNSALGYYAGYQDVNGNFSSLSALQNSTAIGAYAQAQSSNSIVLGSVDTITNVGIGITVPNNILSVSPLDYQTGTATRTNSSATLVGTGTTWTSAMIGDIIVFADGTTNTVSAFTSATSITMGTTYTGTTDASPVHYRFHHVGLQVTSGGNVYARNGSTAAFQVQNAGGNNLLTADTTNMAIVLGNDTMPSAVTVRGGAASGSNIAGSNLTFDASNGTGTGASGDLIFRTATAASGSVTQDAASSAQHASSVTSLTWSHTIGTQSNRLLVVGISTTDKTNTTSSVTYGGVALTKLASTSSSSVTVSEIWYLKNPASGTANIVITLPTSQSIVAGSVSYYNVDLTTPFGTPGTNNGNSTTATVTLNSTNTGQLVFNNFSYQAAFGTWSTSLTQLWNNGSSNGGAGAYTAASAGTTTVTWTNGSAEQWSSVAAAINPMNAASSDSLLDRLHITATGNVGINNSSPQRTLDVIGTARIRSDSTTSLQVQNAMGSSMLTVDTVNSAIVVGADTSPSAMTVRGGAASGSNAAGANLTVDASNGTGTGGSGDLIFRTATASGTTITQDYSSGVQYSTSTTSLTWTHTVGSWSNRLLVVGISVHSISVGASTVTYGGVSLTKLASTHSSTNTESEIWYLKNPTPGTATIAVSFGSSVAATAGSVSYYNVDQTTPLGSAGVASGSGTPATNTLSGTVANQLVFNSFADAGVTGFWSSSQTVLWNARPLGGSGGAASTTVAAGSTTTMTWTNSGAGEEWSDVAVPINPASSSASNTLTDRLHITASGNIGINNASPQYTLDVGGSTRILLDSTTAFQVQSASGVAVLTADTTNGRLYVGSASADANPTELVLHSYTNATDPTGTNGAMYYNDSTGRFRCYENSTWLNCITEPITVRYEQNTAQTITGGGSTYTAIKFDTAVTTDSSVTASGTGNTTFTLNKAGIWSISTNVWMLGSGVSQDFTCITSSAHGTFYATSESYTGGGSASSSASTTLRLSAGSVIQIYENPTGSNVNTYAGGGKVNVSLTWLGD